jgi:hypothetical protein
METWPPPLTLLLRQFLSISLVKSYIKYICLPAPQINQLMRKATTFVPDQSLYIQTDSETENLGLNRYGTTWMKLKK